MSFTVRTSCGHCGQPLTLEIDSQLNYRVLEADAEPLVYAPARAPTRQEAPSIINDF